MNIAEFKKLFQQSGKRCELAGDETLGVFAAPDLEARLYLVFRGEVVSRVNPDAILNYSDRTVYRNPGGDGLWPAPEGSRYGYNYATGSWCVSSGLLRARFETERKDGKLILAGEVPLINAQGIGLLTEFRRSLDVSERNGIVVEDSIRYLGPVNRETGSVRLAAWSLSQFDRHDGDFCKLDDPGSIRDLYGDSSRFRKEDTCFPTDEMRYQVACGESCTGIHLILKDRGIMISRQALSAPGTYMDIADIAPSEELSEEAVKYSFYSDPSGFMEIETVGPGQRELEIGDTLTLTTANEIRML